MSPEQETWLGLQNSWILGDDEQVVLKKNHSYIIFNMCIICLLKVYSQVYLIMITGLGSHEHCLMLQLSLLLRESWHLFPILSPRIPVDTAQPSSPGSGPLCLPWSILGVS